MTPQAATNTSPLDDRRPKTWHLLRMRSRTYCSSCMESYPPQADNICLTCGDEMTTPPSTADGDGDATQPSGAAPSFRHDEVALALLASSMRGNTGMDVSTLMPLVNQLHGNAVRGGGATNGAGDISDLAAILPPDALNPQAGSSRHRPVSQKVLDGMKRTVLKSQSAELFEAQICLFDQCKFADISRHKSDGVALTLNAVPGEFGPLSSHATNDDEQSTNAATSFQSTPRTAALVVCSPRTTKGGLSPDTLSEIESLRQHRMPFVAYVQRGDGVTFVQKAITCQRAGQADADEKSHCIGVIVGNTASGSGEVWPYTMQDTQNEAETLGLTIPAVMIRRDDGARLVQWAAKVPKEEKPHRYTPCQMQIHSKDSHSHTCPVCTDSYVPGATIVRLPLCGHVFHESCALLWLTKHNTCMYCRREMPTDDAEYEMDRRRREANGSGDGNATDSEINGQHFYG